jgi:N-acetyl sugar amidotransferase
MLTLKKISTKEWMIKMTDNQICTRCLMDSTIPGIKFDEQGVCNICTQYVNRVANELDNTPAGQEKLNAMIERIKKEGTGRDYDCIIGVSGGVDSTYVAYLVKKVYGLRPLAVHLDNGWNSELAVANVEQVLKRLDIDLYTHVLNWEEFKDLQVSFLKSSVSNAEIPTDQAIWALLVRTAAKYRVRYIISGLNIVTEALMPESWLYNSKDALFINAIQRRFGKMQLKSYPELSAWDYAYYLVLWGIRWVPILNYVPYVKNDAKKLLADELGWRDYGGKHYESIYTRFFHAYYLPQKFGIDLRRSYLSALVVSGQITRDDGVKELALPPAPPDQIKQDIEFVVKKLGLTHEMFDQIMKTPPISYTQYPNTERLWKRLSWFVKFARNRAIRVG